MSLVKLIICLLFSNITVTPPESEVNSPCSKFLQGKFMSHTQGCQLNPWCTQECFESYIWLQLARLYSPVWYRLSFKCFCIFFSINLAVFPSLWSASYPTDKKELKETALSPFMGPPPAVAWHAICDQCNLSILLVTFRSTVVNISVWQWQVIWCVCVWVACG